MASATMNITDQMENVTSTTPTYTTTTAKSVEIGLGSCEVGEEVVTHSFPPELMRMLKAPPQLYPLKIFSQEEVALKVTFYVLAMLLNVVGNSLVIFIVVASKKMRTPTNVLLVNLALSDLLIALGCMWVHLGSSITQDWPFGINICKINMFVQVAMITASVLTLTAISMERFFAIVFPLRRGWSLRTTVPIIVVIWVIACGIASVQLRVRYLVEFRFSDRHVISCKEDWTEVYRNEQCEIWTPSKIVYHMFVAVVLFFIPIVIMIVSYTVICVFLLKRKAPGTGSSDNYSKSKRRVVRMLVVLLVVFVACWAPIHVVELISLLNTDHKMPDTESFIAVYTAYLNSALNPILYAGFNENFRKAFRDVLRRGRGSIFKKSGRVGPDRSALDPRSQATELKSKVDVEGTSHPHQLPHNDNRYNNKHLLQVHTIATTAATTSFYK